MNLVQTTGAHSNYFPSGSGGVTYGYDGTILVSGQGFVNGHGTTVQLRGTDCEGPVSASVRHNGGDMWGGTFNFYAAGGPNLTQMANWKFNVVRIGINENTWNNYTTYSCVPTTYTNNDPYSFRTSLTTAIANFNAMGCYVILVLGWAAPGRCAAGGQMVMANQDNSITFWKSLCSYYGYPNGSQLKMNGGTIDNRSVLFELSNEPQVFSGAGSGMNLCMNGGLNPGGYYVTDPNTSGATLVYPYTVNAPTGTFTQGETVTSGAGTATLLSAYQNTEASSASYGQWTLHVYGGSGMTALTNGSTITGSSSGATAVTSNTVGFYIAGHAQMLNAIRATGCGTPCLLSSINFNKDLSQWGAYAPTDSSPPVGWIGGWTPQIAATWHPYPDWSYVSAIAVNSGGTGYAVNDFIYLPMDETTGTYGNSVYWQAVAQVTSVSGGIITGLSLVAAQYGQPGGPTSAHSGNFPFPGNIGGAYCNLALPTNPVHQSDPGGSTSGSGTGASFNLTFHAYNGATGWPGYSNWPTVVTLKTTFNSNAGVPIIITETGEHGGANISNNSPWMSALTSWADTNGVSLLGFNYNTANGWYFANGGDLMLCTNAAPATVPNYANGYGAFMWNWFTTHAP